MKPPSRGVGFALVLPFLAAALSAAETAPLAPASAESLKQINRVLEQRGFPAVPADALAPGATAGGAFLGLVSGPGTPSAAEAPSEFRVRPALSAADAARHPLDDASVAAARGLTVEQLRAIRSLRSQTNREILTLNAFRLNRFLSRLEKPKAAPEGAFNYRNSFLVDESGTVPPGAMERAFAQARRMPLNRRLLPAVADPLRPAGPETEANFTSASWTWKGPGNIGGRIRAMLIHPTNPQLMWIGAAGGGIWKSTNGGASWAPVNDFMPNLAVCALAFDPTNASVMYAGTGEGSPNIDAIRGVGIFKSTDGGTTWNKLASTGTADFNFIMRLSVSPNGGTVLAATGTGILRSADGGATWTKVYTSTSRAMCHVEFHPTDNAKAIAAGYGNQLKVSTDGGATWNSPGGTVPSGGTYGRVEPAYARSNPAVIYAVNDTAGGLWKSTDGGATFAKVTVTGNPDFGAGQGWYDLLCWVDPTDPNRVVVGGVDVWRSIDGGLNFVNITQVYSGGNQHPDMHLVINDPAYNGTTNRKIYLLNDGGIARNDDVVTASALTGWTKLNNNLGITQFYGGGGAPAPNGMLIGGTQDNSTLRLLAGAGTSSWGAVIGGDGGYAAVDQTDANFVYGESQNLALRRSTNGGSSFSTFTSGITGTPEFIAPFILHPANQNVLLYGATQLFRSTGARTGTAFTSIKANVPSGVTVTAIGGAPSSADVIYVGYRPGGGVWNTTNGTAASPTWTQVGSGTLPSRRVTRFAIHPTDPQRVIVSFGGFLGGDFQSSRTPDNLWSTTDGGATWTNIHNNLPAAPIYTVIMDPQSPQTLYVGTDAGIYASDNGGASWSGTNLGPSTAPTVELFLRGRELIAVTHGRGMFAVDTGADTIAPSLVITPDATPTNATPIRFRFRFSEPVTGFTASDVSVTNGLPGAFTAVSTSEYTLDVLPSGGATSVSVAAGAAQDAAGNLSLAAAASGVAYDATSPFLFASAFDGAAAPRGWTTIGSWQWGTPSGAGPGGDHTGGGSCFGTTIGGNYPDNDDAYLTTPPFDVPALGAAGAYKLRFWMWMNAEADYDGGNLEVSVNGGAWNLVPSSALTVPYNDLSVDALPGGQGWSGTQYATWTRVRADLSAYAGQRVQFRFHFASDGGVTAPGWYIDDVALEQDPVLALAPPAQVVTEGNTATVSLQLSPRAPGPLSVPVSVSGTAVAGTDYPALPGAFSVAAGAGTSSVAVTPTQDGNNSPRAQTVILTLAGGGEYTVGAANMATVVLLGNSGFDLWRAANFSPAQLTDPAVSGPNATPANDGVSNILKFALGLSPFVPSAGFLPVSETVNVGGQNYVQIRIARPAGLQNVTYQGEVSGTLLTWSSSAADVETIVTTGPGAGQQTVTYRDRTPLGSNPNGLKRFLRLRVTIP